ncbi:MAG: hypothetical protein P8X96_20265 [Desulfobacteraceae bacterium]
MEAIQNVATCSCPKDMSTDRSLTVSQTQLAAVSSSRSLDMDLVTDEGDRVTLSIATQASAVYAAYGEVGVDDGDFHGEWGEFSGGAFEREVSFSVEGDLNRQERREIRKVIKTLHRMMNDFVQNRLNPMVSKAQKLQGLETIDSLEVDMAYERQVLVAQQTTAAISYDRTGEVAPARPELLPVEPVDVPVSKEAEVVAMDMASEVVSAPVPMDPLKELADRLLEAYQDRAAEWHPLAGQVVAHMRDLFEAAVGGYGQAVSFGDINGMPSENTQ